MNGFSPLLEVYKLLISLSEQEEETADSQVVEAQESTADTDQLEVNRRAKSITSAVNHQTSEVSK